jgi:YesN/AraC family two-component response regulator
MMTKELAFPVEWKVNELQIMNPIMIMAGVNQPSMSLLLSFIDSLDTINVPDETNALLMESLSFIEENLYEEDLSLEKVASHIYVSRCHYSRMFHKHFGTSFKKYVMKKRIQKAKVLLQKGKPVTEVCYLVGYNDLTHFGRVFKKLVGVKPSVYRQQTVWKQSV